MPVTGGTTPELDPDQASSASSTTKALLAAALLHERARGRAAASHGLFTAAAADLLAEPALDQLAVTDSVPPFRPDAAALAKLRIISVAPLIAKAIRRIHAGGSLVGPTGD